MFRAKLEESYTRKFGDAIYKKKKRKKNIVLENCTGQKNLEM